MIALGIKPYCSVVMVDECEVVTGVSLPYRATWETLWHSVIPRKKIQLHICSHRLAILLPSL